MVGCGCVEMSPSPKVETQGSLHHCPPACNRQAKGSGEVVNEIFKWVQVGYWGQKAWAAQELGYRFAISHLNASNTKLLKECEDLSSRIVCYNTHKGVRQHTYPDGRLVVWRFPSRTGLLVGMSS